MKKNIMTILFTVLMVLSGCVHAQNQPEQTQPSTPVTGDSIPKVYFFREISAENLVRIYEALGREASGKVAVKLSTGEPGGHNFLQPSLIKDLVQKVHGTIVECNTAYGAGVPIRRAI